MKDIVDLTIIGGGPTGLFGAFYAGMRGMSCRIVDSLPELGGQLTALYPEKYIFDVGGFPKVLAKDLARELVDQGLQFGADVVLDEEVRGLREEDGVFVLEGASSEYRTRTVLIAGGKGAFEPMVLKCPGYEELLGHGVEYSVRDPEVYRGKRVVLVGGGDSALDWALILKDIVERLVVVHRRAVFRAHETSVARLEEAAHSGELELRVFWEVKEIRGKGLLLAVELHQQCTQLAQEALDRGLLLNVAAGNVVRLLPPLVVEDSHGGEAAGRVEGACREFAAAAA